MILIDTSVYISALADSEIENMIREAGKKAFIISSEVIEREINKASFYLQKIGKRRDSERLKEIYNFAVGGTIKLTERVINISDKYSDEVRINLGKDKANEMEDDFRIVASASVAGIKHIATFNRKTMSNEEIVTVYERINQSSNLKTPKFIKTKGDLFALLSSI